MIDEREWKPPFCKERGTEFVEDRYGIPVPQNLGAKFQTEQFKQFFSSRFLAVDLKAQRIGYGKGVLMISFWLLLIQKVSKIGAGIFEPIASDFPSESLIFH